jgi:hypothetical protein
LGILHSEFHKESARLAARLVSRNIASATKGMHRDVMRRSIALSLTLLVAACATAPQQTAAPQPSSAAQPQETGSLLGLTAQDLVGRFGAPALQIREGSSLKLQFRGPSCVLDAYLYPSAGSGALKVSHVDTRLPSGNDVDQAACIAGLGNRSM